MERQTKIAKVITDFFEKDGYRHGHFNWDGTSGYGDFTIGQAGANAVATYALLEENDYTDLVKKVLQKAWDSKPIVGSQRYYDGLVHFLAMLHLTGNFKIWKVKPEIEKKTANGEYNGVKYDKDTTFHAFESCKLYEVTVKPEPKQDTTVKDTTVKDTSDAIRTLTRLSSLVKVRATSNSIVIENAPVGSRFAITDLNGRVLAKSMTNSQSQEIRIRNKGVMLVVVGDRAYKVVK
jgi:oligosaccharide reducing-end xylanase